MNPAWQNWLLALSCYTRIPVALRQVPRPRDLQRAGYWLPVVGWLVGGCAALLYVFAGSLVPPLVAVLLVMILPMLLTGALHEDGLGDCCDGFFGSRDRGRVLEIMKDSRLGTFGLLGILTVLSLQFGYLRALPGPLLPFLVLAAHSLSRLAALGLMHMLPYAGQPDGWTGRIAAGPRPAGLLPAAVAGLLPLALPPLRPVVWLVVPAVLLVTVLLGLWFRRRIGGYTGDCLGATQQVALLTVYAAGWLAVQPDGP